MHELDTLAMASMCARCHAGPRERCRTRTGKRATYLHAPRTHPVWEAYAKGYTEGRAEL